MRVTRALMGMPVIVELIDGSDADIERIFAHFADVDARFSTYKHDSEVNRLNRGDLILDHASADMLEVLRLCDAERIRTNGYFDARTPAGVLDPSGLVKGWAIRTASKLAERMGYHDYWIEAGGDIQLSGNDEDGRPWSVGIRHPFEPDKIVDAIEPGGRGVATSGTYLRGVHIYDPHTGKPPHSSVVSLTVVARDVYEADLWATTAFAMGESGLDMLAAMPGIEAYAIDADGIATHTAGWQDLQHTASDAISI